MATIVSGLQLQNIKEMGRMSFLNCQGHLKRYLRKSCSANRWSNKLITDSKDEMVQLMSKKQEGIISWRLSYKIGKWANVNIHTALRMGEWRVHLNAVFGLVRVADYDTGQMIQQCCNAIKIKNPHTVWVSNTNRMLTLSPLCCVSPNISAPIGPITRSFTTLWWQNHKETFCGSIYRSYSAELLLCLRRDCFFHNNSPSLQRCTTVGKGQRCGNTPIALWLKLPVVLTTTPNWETRKLF